MPARHFLSSDRSNSLTPAKNSHFILRGSSRISADLASERRKDGRDVSRARVNLQRRDLVGDRHDVDRRRCNSRESRSATGQEGRPRGRLESGTKRKREEEGAARCRHLDSRRLNATVPPDSTCRTKKLEREKTLFPRMPLCSSKTFQIVGRISLFLAPLPRGKQNYTIPLFLLREWATIGSRRRVCPSLSSPPPLLPLFFVRATVVKQKAGIAVKLLARVSTDRGDVALLSAHAALR